MEERSSNSINICSHLKNCTKSIFFAAIFWNATGIILYQMMNFLECYISQQTLNIQDAPMMPMTGMVAAPAAQVTAMFMQNFFVKLLFNKTK